MTARQGGNEQGERILIREHHDRGAGFSHDEGNVRKAIRKFNENPVRKTNLAKLEAMLVSRDWYHFD